ncbi:MAG: hypothetical protein AB1611_02355 [bacterium]
MATPAFREFSKANPDCTIGIAVKRLVYDSRILDRCPYFHKIHIISDVWKGRSYRRGLKRCVQEGKEIQKAHGYEKVICINQKPAWRYGIHKIHRTAHELGVWPLTDTRTEIYLSNEDRSEASSWLDEHGYQENNYIFLHRQTAFPPKDLPEKVAQEFLKELPPLPVIEVGKTYSIQERPINFSFAILEKARYIIVVDSVFLHAANALGKDITKAYFAIRPGIVEEVGPLQSNCECRESYSGYLDFLRRIYWWGQKGIYKTFFEIKK